MCGIAGVIGLDRLDDHEVELIGASIRHRGPDGEGVWRGGTADTHVLLVHRRLSIIGLADGHQPMASVDGSRIVVYNGEIYNYPELRKDLESRGVTFRTRCDTEVLLHLHAVHGQDMVDHLRGMFAFAIWDANTSSLFCARDHLGQKPFFFVHDPARQIFAFASEIKGLLATGIVDHRVDMDCLWHHTGLRFCPDDTTLISGIRKLCPGQRATYRPTNAKLEIDRYWTLDYRSKETWSFEESLDRLEDILDGSVKAHLLADVPTGGFLSGGIDSSTVAALAVRHCGKKWPTFSIGVGDGDFSELPAARLASETIGTRHQEQEVNPNLFLMLPDIIWHLEEPSDPHAVGIWLLSKMARSHVKVVLGGDGGDEAFGGYTRFARSRVLDVYSAIPRMIRTNLLAPIIRMLPESYSYYSTASKARWVHQMSLRQGAKRQALALTFFRFTEAERRQLFMPESIAVISNPDTDRFIAEHHDSDVCNTELDRLMYTEQMTRMAEHDLRIADRMSMAHSLELRAPIMDRHVMSFAARLPATYKIRPGRLKIILRELCRRFYPDEFVDRRKYGFGFPMARWYAGELSPFVQRIIDDGDIFATGLLSRQRAQVLFDEHRSGRIDHNFKLWNLINLEVWYRLFIGKQTREQVRDWLAERLGIERSDTYQGAAVGRFA